MRVTADLQIGPKNDLIRQDFGNYARINVGMNVVSLTDKAMNKYYSTKPEKNEAIS